MGLVGPNSRSIHGDRFIVKKQVHAQFDAIYPHKFRLTRKKQLYPTTVLSSIPAHLQDWLDQMCRGSYEYAPRYTYTDVHGCTVTQRTGCIWFERTEDAMAFKLAWG